MLLDPSTLAAIQHAGEAVFTAQTAVASATQVQANRVVQAIGANAFGLENDNLFNSWKTLARLAQELQAMEQQLRAVYDTANQLGTDSEVEVTERPRLPAPVRTPLRGKRLAARAAPSLPARVKGNNAKVLGFLGTVLEREHYVAITQARIADGAGVPKGSISLALQQLTERGLIASGPQGGWRLA